MNVAIIGTGYVGLTTGVCLAYLGHKVTCLDADPKKIESLERGEIPFFEPYLHELAAAARDNLTYTTCYAEAVPTAEVVFVAVGTPSQADGSPNLKYLESAARSIAEHLGPHFTVVVNKSTVPIGSGNWVGSLICESASKNGNGHVNGKGKCFAVASNPEFLREGSALFDSLYPDRIVIGSDNPRSSEVLYSLYRPLIEQTFTEPSFLPRPASVDGVPLIATDLASAELTKYAANAFLSLKISYINEIGGLAERVGADITKVAKGIGLDRRIGNRFLQAGVGWGGSCFGKDTSALISTAAEYGLDMPIVKAARDVNFKQRDRVLEKLLGELKILKGRTIGLLGLAFKPDTDDLRDAPAIDIAKRLIERGAVVKAHDPVAMACFKQQYPDLQVACVESAACVAQDADALVLVTEWQQYRELDWEDLSHRMRKPVLLDGRNILDRGRMTQAGFRYLGLAG